MKKQVFILLCIFFSCLSGEVLGEADEIVDQMPVGAVNWSRGVIQSKGIGAPQPRPMALRAAKLDAIRNLLEVVKGLRLDSTTLVKNYMVEKDVIKTGIEGYVRGARVIDQEYLSDGTVEVTVEMPLYGELSRLLLPRNIRQIDAIVPVMGNGSEPGVKPSAFTGLVVDARGLGVKPAMNPRILDEEGREVYGPAFVGREYAARMGVAGYAKDMAKAVSDPRVSDRPINIKGIRARGVGNSDIVIGNSDAARLKKRAEHLSFLKKCRVMVVLD